MASALGALFSVPRGSGKTGWVIPSFKCQCSQTALVFYCCYELLEDSGELMFCGFQYHQRIAGIAANRG